MMFNYFHYKLEWNRYQYMQLKLSIEPIFIAQCILPLDHYPSSSVKHFFAVYQIKRSIYDKMILYNLCVKNDLNHFKRTELKIYKCTQIFLFIP